MQITLIDPDEWDDTIVTIESGDLVHVGVTPGGNLRVRCAGSDRWAIITPRAAVEFAAVLCRLAHQELPPDRT